jgi:hypothetical protein
MTQPNVGLIMTDQQQAALCKREGFGLDTTPFLDHLAAEGVSFSKAYTSSPTCTPRGSASLPGATRRPTRSRRTIAAYGSPTFPTPGSCSRNLQPDQKRTGPPHRPMCARALAPTSQASLGSHLRRSATCQGKCILYSGNPRPQNRRRPAMKADPADRNRPTKLRQINLASSRMHKVDLSTAVL